MHILQRYLLATVVATGLALATAPSFAQAQQSFPGRPVRLVLSSTPKEYNKILREQLETVSKVVRDAGLRPK